MTLPLPPGCVGAARRASCRVLASPAAAPCPRPRRPPRHALPGAAGAASLWPAATLQARLVSSRSTLPRNRRGPSGAVSRDAAQDDDRGFDRRFTTQLDIERSGRDRPPRDHEITDPQVVVLGSDGASGPVATRLALARLGPDESLRMVQPYLPADAEADRPLPRLAVCKVVNKRDEYARQRQRREAQAGSGAAAKPKTKELDLSWAIGPHDLATKMRQMGGFLAKGSKVELMLARKKGGKPVSPDEAAEVVRRLREEVEAYGGREAKPPSGQVGGTMRLFVEAAAKQ